MIHGTFLLKKKTVTKTWEGNSLVIFSLKTSGLFPNQLKTYPFKNIFPLQGKKNPNSCCFLKLWIRISYLTFLEKGICFSLLLLVLAMRILVNCFLCI